MQLRRRNEPDRIRRYTTERQLQRIDARTEHHVRLYASQPREVIDARIDELRREWSIERFLQLNAAAVGLTTAVLAVTRDRRWGIATCAGLGFFLLHALDGFDPPLPLLRELGIRSRAEIDREIYALKVLRGDFEQASSGEGSGGETALSAVGL